MFQWKSWEKPRLTRILIYTANSIFVLNFNMRDHLTGAKTLYCFPYDLCFIMIILFYPQSAFYPWSAVCSLHFTPGLQSAVCVLH